MNNKHELLANTLNELVHINYDRMNGYEKAFEETGNAEIELRLLCRKFADMSRGYITYWQKAMRNLGHKPMENMLLPGKIYRNWLELKSYSGGNDQETILNACAFGEKTTLQAYDRARASVEFMPLEYRLEMEKQKANIQGAQNCIVVYAETHDIQL